VQLATSGRRITYPYGGKPPDFRGLLTAASLQAKGSPRWISSNAVNARPSILPTGTVKLGSLEFKWR